MRWTLHRRLFWRVYLTLLGSLALVAVLGAVVWHTFAEPPTPPGVEFEMRVIRALIPPPDALRADTEQALQRLSSAILGTVTLRARDGRPIAVARDGQIGDPSEDGGPKPPKPGFGFRSWRVDLPDGRSLIAEALPRFGPALPRVLGVLLAIAAAVGLTAYPAVARLTRRLETLRAGVEAWGGGRLDLRVPVEGRDEVAAVAASFNAAAGRIETLLIAHKSLLAHASHELRSPLARLRMAVELFQATPTPALRQAIVQDIGELDGLVEEILLASRLDHDGEREAGETVDCLALAAEEAARAGAGISQTGAAAGFEVRGSARLLRRMIRNLVENAAKHGAPPVEIALGAVAAGPSGSRRLIIAVEDHGPGIAEDERERVFEPFYRPAGRAEAAGSWGLGLALVRQIAEHHRGSVRCEQRPGGGARFVVELSAAPDS